MLDQTTADLIARINAREVEDVQSGIRSWYEITIAIRYQGEVVDHRFPIVGACRREGAIKMGRAIAKVMRRDEGIDAHYGYCRQLAYRGSAHPDTEEFTVREAGYARPRR